MIFSIKIKQSNTCIELRVLRILFRQSTLRGSDFDGTVPMYLNLQFADLHEYYSIRGLRYIQALFPSSDRASTQTRACSDK